MPIYEYRCTSCGHQQEFLQKASDPLRTTCTACGKATFTKLVSAAGFQLKGSGWYATDFKGSASKPAKGGDARSSGDAPSTGEAKSGGEAKGEEKKAAPSCGAGGCSAC